MEFIADIDIDVAVAINAISGHMSTMLSKGRSGPDGQVQRKIVGIVGRSEGAIGLPTGAVVLGFAMAVGGKGIGIALVVGIRTWRAVGRGNSGISIVGIARSKQRQIKAGEIDFGFIRKGMSCWRCICRVGASCGITRQLSSSCRPSTATG